MRSAFAVLPLLASSRGFAPSFVARPPQRNDARRASPSTPPPGAAATRLRSVPTSIDTLTSGLASIVRLPRGVTVSGEGISPLGPAGSFLPALKKLYDVENDRESRRVREMITEYDLVVERVVPAAANSRAVEASESLKAPTLVAEVDGKEVTSVGADAILSFLDEKFSKDAGGEESKAEDDEEGDAALDQAKDALSNLLSFLPGILRAGRGATVCSAASLSLSPPRPEKPLVLYSYEGNQFCRLVREVLTELDVVYELRSAGKESPRREELAKITGGSTQCPYLMDPNTGANVSESEDIVEYLYSKYALWTPPNELLGWASGVVTPLLAPLYKEVAPLQAGSKRENEFEYAGEIAEAKAEIYDEISSSPVVIYTYELSPFCAAAIDLLRSTDTPFEEVSLGREWLPGLLEKPATRAALLEMTGQSSLPHVFVGGESVGGLFSGSPGLVPSLERGEFLGMAEDARKSM